MKPNKASCFFFPKEVARRICPSLGKPISSHACAELFNAEIPCANSCAYLAGNYHTRLDRVFRRGAARITGEFPDKPPVWLEDRPVVATILMTEFQLARYGQYYPQLTDQETLLAIEEFRAKQSAVFNDLVYDPPRMPPHVEELLRVLMRAVGITPKTARAMPPRELKHLQNATNGGLDQIRDSIKRHESQGPRAYLDFIIKYAEKYEPLPAQSKLIIPDDTRAESWRQRIPWDMEPPDDKFPGEIENAPADPLDGELKPQE